MGRRRHRLALLSLLAACSAPPAPPPAGPAQRPAPPRVELVESTPIETPLDHPDIPDAHLVWPQMIARAKTSIDIGQFYVSNAPASRLEPTIRALEDAIRRKVTVRLLVDKAFTKSYPETLARLQQAGATLRILDLSQLRGALHAKYFIVDGREAFFGSQNFDWRALEHIVELGARIEDPGAVARLALIFAHDWARAGGEQPPASPALPAAHASIELVASPKELLPPGVGWDLPHLVSLIESARRSIRVAVLTYRAGDWTELAAPLAAAVARGVRVEIAISDWVTRPKTIESVRQLARAGITVRIVTIPPWSGGFIPYARVTHAKYLVVDRTRGWLGTSNWERGYFYEDRNVGIVIREPALAAQLATFSDSLWSSRYAVPFDPDATYTPPKIGD